MNSRLRPRNGQSRQSFFLRESPHFLKILKPVSIRRGKLEIPKEFIEKFMVDLPEWVILKAPSGAGWIVYLEKNDGSVWLAEGWKNFLDGVNISPYYSISFRFDGISTFDTIVFDKTQAEIEHVANCYCRGRTIGDSSGNSCPRSGEGCSRTSTRWIEEELDDNFLSTLPDYRPVTEHPTNSYRHRKTPVDGSCKSYRRSGEGCSRTSARSIEEECDDDYDYLVYLSNLPHYRPELPTNSYRHRRTPVDGSCKSYCRSGEGCSRTSARSIEEECNDDYDYLDYLSNLPHYRHDQATNRSSQVSPANASLSRSVISYFLVVGPISQSKIMEIPREFVGKHGNDLMNRAVLKVPTGETWTVKLDKQNGKVFLGNGWKTFLKNYLVLAAYSVVFGYEGNSRFQTVIVDETGCEIKYRTRCSRRNVPNREDDFPFANEDRASDGIQFDFNVNPEVPDDMDDDYNAYLASLSSIRSVSDEENDLKMPDEADDGYSSPITPQRNVDSGRRRATREATYGSSARGTPREPYVVLLPEQNQSFLLGVKSVTCRKTQNSMSYLHARMSLVMSNS